MCQEIEARFRQLSVKIAQAVVHQGTHLRIIASGGTVATTTLCETCTSLTIGRILIDAQGVDVNNIVGQHFGIRLHGLKEVCDEQDMYLVIAWYLPT